MHRIKYTQVYNIFAFILDYFYTLHILLQLGSFM